MSDSVNTNLFDLLQHEPQRLYFVAEAGLNHGGSREKAMSMVRAAKWAGVTLRPVISTFSRFISRLKSPRIQLLTALAISCWASPFERL